MPYKTSQSKVLFFLLFTIFLAVTMACSLLQSTTPANSAPTAVFKPGDPTATPLGTDITDTNFIKGVEAYQAKKYNDVISLMSIVIDANPNTWSLPIDTEEWHTGILAIVLVLCPI